MHIQHERKFITLINRFLPDKFIRVKNYEGDSSRLPSSIYLCREKNPSVLLALISINLSITT